MTEIRLSSKPNMAILNGDGGAFFKAKIFRFPAGSNVYERMRKWIGKTFKYYITGFKVTDVVRADNLITLKWRHIYSEHDEYGNVLAWRKEEAYEMETHIFLDTNGRVGSVHY